MPKVGETPRATQQAELLRGRDRQAYERFLDDLAVRGCAALGYRLSGDIPVDRLCVKHLRGTMRVVVAFHPGMCWVLLVGPHDNTDPDLDVYTELYELLGVEPPTTARNKPPCCAEVTKAPLLDKELVADIVDTAVQRRRSRR